MYRNRQLVVVDNNRAASCQSRTGNVTIILYDSSFWPTCQVSTKPRRNPGRKSKADANRVDKLGPIASFFPSPIWWAGGPSHDGTLDKSTPAFSQPSKPPTMWRCLPAGPAPRLTSRASPPDDWLLCANHNLDQLEASREDLPPSNRDDEPRFRCAVFERPSTDKAALVPFFLPCIEALGCSAVHQNPSEQFAV
jgi:hypothetical protein